MTFARFFDFFFILRAKTLTNSTKMVLKITETNGSEQLEAVMEFKRLN